MSLPKKVQTRGCLISYPTVKKSPERGSKEEYKTRSGRKMTKTQWINDRLARVYTGYAQYPHKVFSVPVELKFAGMVP